MAGASFLRPRTTLVAALASFALLASCSDDPEPATGGTGVVDDQAGLGTVALTDLSTRDCFDGLSLDGAEQIVAETVDRVSCRDPHDHEVFHAFAFAEDEPYPGDDALVELAESGCADAFVERVGNAAVLDQISIWPSAASWSEGDRTVLCAVFARDGDQLVGTIR